MKAYWLKIAGGALTIFAVGLGVIFGFRSIHHRVDGLVHGNADITIPLLGLVPLSIGQSRVGSIRQVEIHRDAPGHVSGFTVVARLDDSVDADSFDDCYFTVHDPARIDNKTTFVCLDSIPDGMHPFGTLQLGDRTDDAASVRPLLLTATDIADLQNAHRDASVSNVDSLSAAADSIGAAARRMGDSIRRVMRARYGDRSTGTVYHPTRPDPRVIQKPPAKPKAAPGQ